MTRAILSGCTGNPRVYSLLPCDPDTLRVCGRYGKNEYWDLDWYRLTLHAWTTLSVCVLGEGRAQLVIINPTCHEQEVMHCNLVPEVNGRVCCNNPLGPADYLIFIRPYHRLDEGQTALSRLPPPGALSAANRIVDWIQRVLTACSCERAGRPAPSRVR